MPEEVNVSCSVYAVPWARIFQTIVYAFNKVSGYFGLWQLVGYGAVGDLPLDCRPSIAMLLQHLALVEEDLDGH